MKLLSKNIYEIAIISNANFQNSLITQSPLLMSNTVIGVGQFLTTESP